VVVFYFLCVCLVCESKVVVDVIFVRVSKCFYWFSTFLCGVGDGLMVIGCCLCFLELSFWR
jgi:hypothetical protein